MRRLACALALACLAFPAHAADAKPGFDPTRDLGISMRTYGMALGLVHGIAKACKFGSSTAVEERDAFKRRGEEMNRTIGKALPDSLGLHDTFANGAARAPCDLSGFAEAVTRLHEARIAVDRDYDTWHRLDQAGFFRPPQERQQATPAAPP